MPPKKTKRPLEEPLTTPFHNPFAQLLSQHASTTTEQPPPTAAVQDDKQATIDLSKSQKIVLQREKKGRKGKTVTLIRGLEQQEEQLQQLARQLSKALGCGSSIEEGQILLQGDLTTRIQEWLEQHGASKVVVANPSKSG